MAKKLSVSIASASLRAERAEIAGQIAAAQQRIRDLLLAGENTADERTEISRLVARATEIDGTLMRRVKRDHGADMLAVDREMQRLLADHTAALDALRGALTLKFVRI
jgi:hypothetical protein